VERDVPLSDHTTIRIGGPAELLAPVRTVDELSLLLREARALAVPVTCLGGGSNVVVADDGVPGIVAVIRIAGLAIDGTTLRCGGGESWDDAVAASVDQGLAGIAAMSGIPGSVGGAVYGNAGAYGESVGERLVSATVLGGDGSMRSMTPEDLRFRYRESALKETGDLVVEAQFALQTGYRAGLLEERERILATRAAKHPSKDEPTAGSFFENIADEETRLRLIEELDLPRTDHRIAAGLLLDRVGACGRNVGDAAVFERHANIIVNRGSASAADVAELSRWMRERVAEEFGVDLEREVIWLGEESPDDTQGAQ